MTPPRLPYGHDLYFQRRAGEFVVPLERLRPTKPPGSQPAAEAAAAERMDEAARHEREPREPLVVRESDDGTFEVLDGNATLSVAMRSRWPDIPVRVAEGE